ncbi:MAG: flavodoxin family protein [Candidatus Methanomethylophilaceae archaeon]|nr:flavodoxin family protein [Candidatus Methanomethylophilaceae archaeon]
MTKIVAINGSPRNGWNTDMLIGEAIKGAESKGAEVIKFDLYKLDKFTGCISCFGCKRDAHKGECVCKDGLKPVLDAVKDADGIIMGAPNYFGDLCAEFKLFYERLVFPYLTYNAEEPCCNTRMIPVLLIMTSNAPDTMYANMLNEYKGVLSKFVGPTEVFVSGETQQVKDYSKFNWTMFDGEQRYERREKVFPQELKAVFKKGASLASKA